MKIAIVVSHPIQHFCPQYVSLASNNKIKLKVFFASALGYKKYVDANFKREISWDNLQLDKFDHVFLNGEVVIPVNRHLDSGNLEENLTSYDPELVIIYGYFQKLQRRAHKWTRRNKKSLAYISDSEFRHHRNKLKESLKFLFIKYFFSKIDYFLSVGDANEEFYKYYGVAERRIIRMHFPIDIEEYQKAYSKRNDMRGQIRRKFDISDDDNCAIVVGKLVPWKNQDHIIEAMAILEEQEVYMQLFILGSGEMMDEWQRKATKLKYSKVHFVGFVEPSGLPSYYAASDIYIHSASVEPHSIAVSEAIYMGCPVIISDRCGSYGDSDDVQPGKNGFVYQFGNTKELAAMIRQLLTDVKKRNSFSHYSHEIARAFQNIAHFEIVDTLLSAKT